MAETTKTLPELYPLIFKVVRRPESAIYEMPKNHFISLFGHLSLFKNAKLEDTIRIEFTAAPAGSLRKIIIL